MVKPKTGILHIFTAGHGRVLALILPAVSLLTFISGWLAIFPTGIIERWYARTIFPIVSHAAGRFADSVSFSWLDVGIPIGVLLLVLLLRKRWWTALLNVAAVLYLIFFWTWGLNYHRESLQSKMQLD